MNDLDRELTEGRGAIVNIAVDGPSGAGKSTLAKALAAELGIGYLDTGAMYRALGFAALERGLSPSDPDGVGQLLETVALDVAFADGRQQTMIDGIDVSPKIRTPDVSMAASDISALPAARHFCVERQRAFAARSSFVLDGRDIGTFVLPAAPIKFFLTASDEVRAARRLKDLRAQGVDDSYEDVLEAMRLRDRQDSSRQLAPTRAADDAVLIDSTDLSADDVLELMLAVCRERGVERR